MFDYYNIISVKKNFHFVIKPSSRSQARMVLYEKASKKIYMFGGVCQGRTNELWKCDIIRHYKSNSLFFNNEKPKIKLSFQWNQIESNSKKPAKRTGHSMILYKDDLIIYGGIINEEETYESRNDILFYNIPSNVFTIKSFNGRLTPPWRRNHIAELIGKYMVIFGGIEENIIDNRMRFLNDFWVLNLAKYTWAKIKTVGDSIPPLHSMSSCVILYSLHKQDESLTPFKLPILPESIQQSNIETEGIYIFGGIDEKRRCTNSLYILKISRPNQVIQLNLNGKPPFPRIGCSMHYYSKLNVIILFGGKNESVTNGGGYFNDFWFIDLEMKQWVRMDTDVGLQSRADHSSVIYDDFIIIFGGTNGQYYHKSEMLIANLHLIRNKDVDCSTSKHEIVKTSERLNPLKIKEESPESRNSRRSKDYFSWDDPERGIAHKYYETFHLKSKDIESKMNDIYIESNNYTPNQFS